MVAYARRRVAAENVDDVVAETFLVAWRRLDAVPQEALPWLLGVTRKVIATQHRGARRRQELVVRLGTLDRDSPMANEPTDADDRVLVALARLAEKDQEALMLTTWEGLRPAAAARVMGVSPGAFRVRLHRAKRRLRRSLGVVCETAEAPIAHSLAPKETTS